MKETTVIAHAIASNIKMANPTIFIIIPNTLIYSKSSNNAYNQFRDAYTPNPIRARPLNACADYMCKSRLSAYHLPFIASITCANKSSGTFANVMSCLDSVSIFPDKLFSTRFFQFSGSRLHNAKINAVGFGAAFL